MPILSRRLFLQGAGGLILAGSGLSAYAVGVEPKRLVVTSYRLSPAGWPKGLRLKAAILSDIHACEPWMSAERIRSIATFTNQLAPDLVFLLGDFNGGHDIVSGPVMADQWAEALSHLKAPLGTFAVLGNHDWWHGALPNLAGNDGETVRRNLRYAGINVMENHALRCQKNGQDFWVLGLADQIAWSDGRGRFRGADNLDGPLAQIDGDAPAILLAHEPYIFPRGPQRISLTLSGHTHGGQVYIPMLSDAVFRAAARRNRYIYGHVFENNRHMIISAGLGTSRVPVRFMRPPEIVLINLDDGSESTNIVLNGR